MDELVESTTTEELKSTVRTASDEFVDKEIVRDLIAKLSRISVTERMNLIPEHALHEKNLQRQMGIVTLASRQERRALFFPLINRGYTADAPLVNRWSNACQPRVFPLFLDILGMKQACRDKKASVYLSGFQE